MSTGSPGHDEIDGGQRPAKRRRVALAWRPCRERKSRCNGGHPTCETCMQQGSECSYPPQISKSDLLRQEVSCTIESLEERMAGMERVLATIAGNQAVPPAAAARLVATNATTQRESSGEITIHEDALQCTLERDPETDGIGIVPSTSREDAFFGPSSNIAFVRLVSRALSKVNEQQNPNGKTQTNDASGGHTRNNQIPPSTKEQEPSAGGFHPRRPGDAPRTFSVPHDSKARELIRGFFLNCGHVHPYIHEGRFMQSYEQARRSNFTEIRRSWLALLYVLFAIAAQSWPYCESPYAVHNAEAATYYNLGFGLCLEQVFNGSGPSIEVVQCLIAISLYLQGTYSSSASWMFHGIAIRLAYQLGLHSGGPPKSMDPIECEVRVRVWFGVLLLDRTMSMTHGRPSQILELRSAVRRPQVYLDPAQRGMQQQDESSVAFFNAMIDLYEFLYKTIEDLYGKNGGGRTSFTLKTIAKVYTLEGDLAQWTSDLVPQLSILTSSELAKQPMHLNEPVALLIRRQRTVITLRFHNARILVHRPVLEGLMDLYLATDPDPQHAESMSKAGANCVALAMSSAVECVEIVHHLIAGSTHGHQQLGAWWFSIYYTFNACLAILAGLAVSQPGTASAELLTKQEQDAAFKALQQSLEVLDCMDPSGEGPSTVTRCRDYLKELVSIAEPMRIGMVVTRDAISTAFTNGAYDTSYDPAMVSTLPMTASSMGYMAPSSLFRQFSSNADLESFLFPVDMQSFGGHLMGFDQPFI
ncbi:hypothetical protein CLAFUW4_05543 [Fulvia fulva]|nr:hypothetical protein CLAFUR4_05537 [Fulvia fulva]WPV15612.1 hypothetical protein CLAFUW4_05543 [Fulvia fulva]WPV30045.1 hypothetical protein CLAFUW7_05541 [Fulvia fulva]